MTTTTTPTAVPRSTRRWTALGVLALAQFLVVLDASIVNIALPVVGRELGLDTVALAWIITAYVLPFGALLLLGGRLADRFGHRMLFLIGAVGFVSASALAGFSSNGGMLLVARALQGTSAAVLAPAALALLTILFPEARDRARALGIWGGVAGIGSVAGVLLGGVLTATLGWQWVFFVNVPVGAVVLVFIPLLITRDPAARASRLDVPGAVTITAALVSLVGGLSAIEQAGPLAPITLVLGVLAVAFTVAFVRIERRSPQPLLPFAIFRNRNLASGNIVALLVGGAMVALFFALSVYLQSVLHYDALAAGLSQLPLAGALVVVAGTVPALVNRIGARATVVVSTAVLAAGLVWLALSPVGAGFAVQLLGPTLLIGVGIGGAMVSATQLAVDGVSAEESGLAGGLVNTSQQIGGALGLAVLASVAAAVTGSLSASGAAADTALAGGFSALFMGAAALVVAAGVAAAASGRRS